MRVRAYVRVAELKGTRTYPYRTLTYIFSAAGDESKQIDIYSPEEPDQITLPLPEAKVRAKITHAVQ